MGTLRDEIEYQINLYKRLILEYQQKLLIAELALERLGVEK